MSLPNEPMRTVRRVARVGGKYEAFSMGYHGRCGKKAGLAGKLSKGRCLIGSDLARLGERGIDIARRSSLVIEEIEQTYSSGNVLVVSHKATIRIMLCSLLGIDVGRFRDRISMPVASISIVEMAMQGPLLHMMGDRAYLREHLRRSWGS